MKKSILPLVFLSICATLSAHTIETNKIAKAPVDSKTTFASDAIMPHVDSHHLPGAVSVFYNDGIQETACIGYADVKRTRPISLTNIFAQCSQTKGFCGITIARLVEQGKIRLDDPVHKYLSEFKRLWVYKKFAWDNSDRILTVATNTLTIRMVMNHTGGLPFDLPAYQFMGGWTRRMPIRDVAVVASTTPLNFQPGTGVQYSNIGIDIGAAIVEAVTKKPWHIVVQETILDPLGMTNTTFWPTKEQLANKIELFEARKGSKAIYRKDTLELQEPFTGDGVFPSAGAGLWTTVEDQLKFYKMLMNLGVGDNGVRILKEETVKKLLAVSTRPPNMGGYSLGLVAPCISDDGENSWFGHGGAWQTLTMVNWRKKQLKLIVTQCCGSGPKPWMADHEKAASKFFKAKIDTKDSEAYTGRMQ